VSLFSNFEATDYFHETWYERFALREHHGIRSIHFLKSVKATMLTSEIVTWEQQEQHIIEDSVTMDEAR
jgi:hypothetical protein